jgi:phosphoglucosamine mutase
VFHELGAEVISIGDDPDGVNINAGVGAMHPQFLQAAVKEHGADLGLALDGDGDRLVMVDAHGRLYDGDQLLYVIALDQLRRRTMTGGVVGTQMSNLGFEQALTRSKIPFARAPVGDRYVLETMQQKGWTLGGENSGHIICLDKHTTGDAIVAALAVLRALCEQKTTLAAATADAELFPQRLINVPIRNGFDWKGSEAIRRAEQEAVVMLDGSGRVLLRPSGTEPVLRVMVEAREAGVADQCAKSLADVVAKAAA